MSVDFEILAEPKSEWDLRETTFGGWRIRLSGIIGYMTHFDGVRAGKWYKVIRQSTRVPQVGSVIEFTGRRTPSHYGRKLPSPFAGRGDKFVHIIKITRLLRVK